MGQMGLALVRAPEGKTPIGEAHSHPPDLPDPQMQGSTVREPESDHPKARVCAHQARRPVLDEGAHTRPDPWPNLGVVIVEPGYLFRVSITARGGQNIDLPRLGSELRAASSAHSIFPIFIFTLSITA